jgi:hypothetical protein
MMLTLWVYEAFNLMLWAQEVLLHVRKLSKVAERESRFAKSFKDVI